MNFRLGDSPGKLRTDIVLSDRDTHEVFSDKLRFIFIELPAFTKEEEECITDFERWIYVLKNMETLNRLPFKARKAVFEKLEKIIDIASLTKEEREKYDESIKVYRDQLVTIAFAKEKGIEEGMEKGMEKGRKEGEKMKQLEIARNMKAKDFATEDISELTGLPVKEIKELYIVVFRLNKSIQKTAFYLYLSFNHSPIRPSTSGAISSSKETYSSGVP